MSDRKTQLRRKRRLQGLCPDCGERPVPGQTRCIDCAEKNAQYQREHVDRLRSRGMCVSCGQAKAEKGRPYCTDCRVWYREYRRMAG